MDHDFVIIGSDGGRVKAHKCILAASCDYFMSLFSNSFSDSSSNEIKLDFKKNDIQKVVDYIYLGPVEASRSTEIVNISQPDDDKTLDIIEISGNLYKCANCDIILKREKEDITPIGALSRPIDIGKRNEEYFKSKEFISSLRKLTDAEIKYMIHMGLCVPDDNGKVVKDVFDENHAYNAVSTTNCAEYLMLGEVEKFNLYIWHIVEVAVGLSKGYNPQVINIIKFLTGRYGMDNIKVYVARPFLNHIQKNYLEFRKDIADILSDSELLFFLLTHMNLVFFDSSYQSVSLATAEDPQ
jgi:hypothetical protein